KLGKGEFGTPRRLEYKDILDLTELKDEQGKPFTAKAGMELEYWLEAADACDYPKPNVGASARFKIKVTDPNNEETEKKDKKVGTEKQKKHEENQAQELKNQQGEREKQKQREEEQEKKDAEEREKNREKNKGNKPDNKPENQGGKGEQDKTNEPK